MFTTEGILLIILQDLKASTDCLFHGILVD